MQLPRTVVALLGVAALVVVLAGIEEFRGILGPSFLAVVLILTLEPVRAAVCRRGAPGWAGSVGLIVVAYAIFLGLVGALALSAAQLAVLLPRYSGRVEDLAVQAAAALEPIGVTTEQVTGFIASIDLSSFVGQLRPLVGGATSALSILLLVVILILFLGLEEAAFARRLTSAPMRPELLASLRAFVERTRRYMVVSSIFGLIVAVADVAVLYALGVPVPLVWGLLSFVTNYVPNVGFVLGVAPPAVIALLQGDVWQMAAVIVAYCVINFVIQSLIQPKVVGDAVGLSATATFLSLIFWAVVMGPLGGLLAVPLTLLVKAVLIDPNPSAQWLAALVGDERRVAASHEQAEAPAGAPDASEHVEARP